VNVKILERLALFIHDAAGNDAAWGDFDDGGWRVWRDLYRSGLAEERILGEKAGLRRGDRKRACRETIEMKSAFGIREHSLLRG
jgi:hypothetical protein